MKDFAESTGEKAEESKQKAQELFKKMKEKVDSLGAEGSDTE